MTTMWIVTLLTCAVGVGLMLGLPHDHIGPVVLGFGLYFLMMTVREAWEDRK